MTPLWRGQTPCCLRRVSLLRPPMPGILPLESEIADDRVAYSFVDLASGDASTVISTLASTNARRILTELNEQPGTASALADSVGTSIQNVLYHLTSLQEAELVEHVDT